MLMLIKFFLPLALSVALFSVIFYPLHKQRSTGKTSPLVNERLNFPGESLKTKLSDMLDDVVFYLICAYSSLAVLIAIIPTNLAELTAVKFLICVSCCLVILYVALNLKSNMSAALNYRVGLDGEEYTGQQLTLLLKHGADVFHDIPYKYGNIDHVVVGHDKVFAVETKAVRKPAPTSIKNGKKHHQVEFDGKRIIFPTFGTTKPVEQAKRHAKWLRQHLSENIGLEINVIPVVALPGWWVIPPKSSYEVLVINPKNSCLLNLLGKPRYESNRKRVVESIQELASFGVAKSKITDPDFAKHFDWMNRRIQKQAAE